MDSHSILSALTDLANTLWPLAAVFHGAVAVVLVILVRGTLQPTRRTALLGLAVPTLSVAAAAAWQGNVFNAATFGALSLWHIAFALRGPASPVGRGPTWALVLGSATLGYAWVYPHFLVDQPWWMYVVAAPLGVVPCPTLALLSGLAMWGGGLGSRAWALGVSAMALFYAVFGMAVLGVWLDAGLAVAALGLAFVSLRTPMHASSVEASGEAGTADAVGSERARIDAFLSLSRIALVGASSHSEHFSREVMRALLAHGMDVVPIHPSAETIEGRPAFPGLEQVDTPVHGVLIMTPSDATAGVVTQCAALGVRHVWLHRGAGPGSVSDEAVTLVASYELDAVVGRCPLMFVPARPQWVHRAHATALKIAGQYPR